MRTALLTFFLFTLLQATFGQNRERLSINAGWKFMRYEWAYAKSAGPIIITASSGELRADRISIKAANALD